MACALATPAQAQAQAAPSAGIAPPAGSVGGLGDVNIFPKRVVIDERQRIATVGLYNRGSSGSEYEITVVDKIMRPDGQIVDLTAVSDAVERARVKPASGMLRWSPRRVVLRPNDAQTVRLMARIPPELPPGEYRAHFIATAIPDGAQPGLSVDQAAADHPANGIAVRIVPRFGISIPVILRVGETTLTVTMRDAAVVSRAGVPASIALTLVREGTRSAFGDITVTTAGGKQPVAVMRGIGVYPEIGERRVQIPVDPAVAPRGLAPGTRLTITYTDDDFAPGKILARQDIVVP